MDLDETDRQILELLQSDGRMAFSEIARRIDMSSATVHERVNKMEDAGVIKGYTAEVDEKAIGYGVNAIVGLRVNQGREQDTLDTLSEFDGIQAAHITTGEWDVILRVYAEDTEALRQLMFDSIARMDGFDRSHTMVVLGTEYETDVLPPLDTE